MIDEKNEREKYDAAKKESIAAEKKLEVLQKQVASKKLSKDALIPMYKEVREKRNHERRTRYALDLIRLANRPMGHVPKPNKWAQTRGIKLLNSDFVRGERMKISFNVIEQDHEHERLVKELSAWREISRKEAEKIVNGYLQAAFEYRQTHSGMLIRDKYIVNEFQKASPATWTKDRVYIDLETSSLDPYLGEILEIGIVRVEAGTGNVTRYERRFNMEDAHVRDTLGTGAVEVHKISPTDIVNEKPFSDPEVQEEIGRILNDPSIVQVAHRDSFERAWLSQHLDGYWEAYDYSYGDPLVASQDTMWISKFLVSDTERNNLQSFVEGCGGDYFNAHSALPDAEMTYKALNSLAQALTKTDFGMRPTKEERVKEYVS